MRRALTAHAKASAAFKALPPSHGRACLEWTTGAKAAATRERRLAAMPEWLAEGTHRNWKYGRR